MAKWSRDLEDLSLELSTISDNLGAFAYDLTDQKPPHSQIEAMLFSACNHIDRIASDLMELDGELTELRKRNKPQTITEVVTKTMYL